MFIQKIKILWLVNLILFIGVVFIGIEQAGMGAEIAKLERNLEKTTVIKQQLTDAIFESNDNLSKEDTFLTLGFSKPVNVFYFNTADSQALLPVK